MQKIKLHLYGWSREVDDYLKTANKTWSICFTGYHYKKEGGQMFLVWFESPLKEISTSVCVDVIKLQSWNGCGALSVYLASIIFYL